MPKNIKKSNLPRKVCTICGFEMVWRKKWEKVWDDVKYCSDRCRLNSKTTRHPFNEKTAK